MTATDRPSESVSACNPRPISRAAFARAFTPGRSFHAEHTAGMMRPGSNPRIVKAVRSRNVVFTTSDGHETYLTLTDETASYVELPNVGLGVVDKASGQLILTYRPLD